MELVEEAISEVQYVLDDKHGLQAGQKLKKDQAETLKKLLGSRILDKIIGQRLESQLFESIEVNESTIYEDLFLPGILSDCLQFVRKSNASKSETLDEYVKCFYGFKPKNNQKSPMRKDTLLKPHAISLLTKASNLVTIMELRVHHTASKEFALCSSCREV